MKKQENLFSPASFSEEEAELLALLLAEEGFDAAPTARITPRRRTGWPALSFAQQRLWFLDQLAPGSPTYNIPVAIRLAGQLNVKALEQSLNEIVRRHEILRTTFTLVDDQPVQQIAPALEFRLSPLDCQADQIEALARAEASQPFDLARGPLMRAILLRAGPAEHVLLLTLHHLIADGWAMGVFYRELAALYPAFTAGKPSPLPELPIQYADFAAWQREWLQGEVLEKHLAYWRQQLAGAAPVLQLPMARRRHTLPACRRGVAEPFSLSSSLAHGLQILSRQAGATLFMTLLAAFQTLLYRYTHQADLSVGTLIANRNRPEIEGLIGVFINALTLRSDLSGNPTFTGLLQRVRQVALDAYSHQDLPFEMLVEELQPQRDLNHTPLFQVLFVLQNMPMPAFDLPDLSMSCREIDNGTAVYDLTLEMVETPAGLAGSIRYDTDLFDAATIRRMIGHFETLLAGIVADPNRPIAALPLLTEAERRQLRVEWNDTRRDYPRDRCAHQIFEAQVERSPDAVAAVCAGESLTYRQLNSRANRLARLLVELGVGPDVVVALLAGRGLDFLTMILAVFKAGGAYLPLDPLHPAQRLAQILQRSASPLVLTSREFSPILSEALAELPAGTRPRVFQVEELLQQERPRDNLPCRCRPDHLAYVIYTSGSTGLPKGAMVEHAGMLNHLYAKINDLQLTHADRIMQNSSQCFDISVWQFLAALLVGGQVHIVKNKVAHDPVRLLEQVEQERITILQVVPSMLRAMIQEIEDPARTRPGLSTLRWLVPTGEALTAELCRQWLQLYPHIPLLNAYGSTECSDDQCHHPIYEAPPPDFELPTMPIGRPLANTQVYILDRTLTPVPVGVPGELYVGGDGVGRGYLNDPARTAEAFIPDMFSQEPGRRLYKTGDLARYLPDGLIEFLGRVDFMVKIRGFRIELGEIEAALEQHPGVEQAIVLAPGNQHLVAYVVLKQPDLAAEELRLYLKQKLPEYMVPAIFIILAAMPLNANGKVDRQALPPPDLNQTVFEDSYVAPRNWIEEKLAHLWAKILGLERVGVRDNFFELGGHSLLAVRLMAQIHQQFGQDLPLATLFQGATIEHLAEILGRQTTTRPDSPLVGIQPRDPKRNGETHLPFFLIHPADGLVLSYAALARRLGPDQPFYGLQAVGLNGKRPLHTRIEAMAAEYIQAMQTVQPHGPYRLGGWSMGSIVAFEMAQQLHRQGQPVSLLALLDHVAPGAGPESTAGDNPAGDSQLLAAFVRDLRGRFAPELPELPENWQQLEPEAQQQFMLEQARVLEKVAPEGELWQIHRLWQIFKANVRAMWAYRPQVYPGQIVLFRASASSEQEPGGDPALGWGRFSTQPVVVHLLPGDHYSMLAEPQVQILADRLRTYLDRPPLPETQPAGRETGEDL